MENEKQMYSTEVIDLPSGGKLYSVDNPLYSGKISLKYATAREEDILTSKNLIQKGIVIDAFIESLVVDKTIDMSTLLLGDKNAIIVASRIMSYGKDYPVQIDCPKCGEKNEQNVDISSLDTKEVDLSNVSANSFETILPASKAKVRFKILTQADEKDIDVELKGMKKLMKAHDSEMTTRLRHAIIAVNGDTELSTIKKFVDTLLSLDALELRKAISKWTPDVDMNFDFECASCGHSERVGIPLTVQFFWPSGRV